MQKKSQLFPGNQNAVQSGPQQLKPGTKIVRLNHSTTGRNIGPGAIAVVGGAQPEMHDNSNWQSWSFSHFPCQYIYPPQSAGLWSALDPLSEGESWSFYSTMPSSFNMEIPQNDPDDAENYQGGIA
jgi:hypothetical protein